MHGFSYTYVEVEILKSNLGIQYTNIGTTIKKVHVLAKNLCSQVPGIAKQDYMIAPSSYWLYDLVPA